MSNHIINIINHLLCYSDPGVTDNPHQRAFDHRLRMESIGVKNPYGNSRDLAPGESFSLFSTIIPTSLSGASTVEIELVDQASSTYRLSATAGPAGFRTARSVSGLGACAVTVNNFSVAVFDFTGATLAAVQVGDLMRIKGQASFDDGPYAFNPINSGIWKVIGISGTKIYATREVGKPFQAVVETVAGPVAGDVQFYADDGVRPGSKFQVTGTFSPVSQRTYEVLQSTPTSIDFVSTEPIPEESGLTYVANSVVVYSSVKKLVYVEVDQECAVRFNGGADDSNRITPLKTGDRFLKGFMSKMGDSYSCTVVNKSVNTCSIKFFTVE